MDEFTTFSQNFGLRTQTHSSPLKSDTENTNKSASSMSNFDYDSIFKNSSSVNGNKLPVYDNHDLFNALPGLKSKSMSTSSSMRFEESVSVSAPKSSQQSDDFDEFLGSLSQKKKVESVSSKSLSGSDDLVPGFGSGNAGFINRSSSEPTSKSSANTKETSNAMDDPFVVLESTPSTTNAYQSFSTDLLEEIGSISKSGSSQNMDPLNGFGKSVPAFTSETNKRGKDQGPLKEGSEMGRAQSSTSIDATQKASFRYSESRSHVTDFQESRQTVFDIPEVSRSHNRSFDQSTSTPSYDTNSQMGQADEIWLTVSEIPLFTQPTRTPPPSRPPPPIPRHISKPERVSLRSNSKDVNGYSSPKFGSCRIPNDSGDYPDVQSAEERDSTLAAAAAAMKDAMDRAEAKFRHAKEVRERENAKASRNKESIHPDRNEQREKEEEEREKRRIEKERIREVERQKARQAVERVTREARERAAFEAHERASVETRLKSERDAVQRAQADARERAAVGARDRAERAAMEAKQKAEEDSRRRAERAAVERVTSEARKRAAVDARERAAASRMNQQKNDNDLESFFSNSSRPSSAPRPRETYSDSASDPLSQNSRAPEGAHRTSTSGVSSNMRKASSTTNIVDDLSSIFGAAPTSGQFQEVEGETVERRRARLEREQRTQERTAKALAEKNQRDLQSQREQEERHRIGGTLDTEVKRWAAGKEGNLRALLSTLQYVLWPGSGWQPVSLTDLITGVNVKKAYRKATLCIHPDKVQQKGATLQQKYVAEKVFDILKEAWNKFNSEELF